MLPTIKVKSNHPRGYVIMNKADFVDGRDELWSDEPAPWTRDAVAAITDKALVIQLLEAHGAEPDKRKGLDALRDDLLKLMFLDA